MVIPGIKQLVWTSWITRIPPGGGGVIQISSDGDKIFDSGIFLDGITLGGLIW